MLKSKRYIISRSEFPDENQVELLEISTGKTTRVNKDQINKTDFANHHPFALRNTPKTLDQSMVDKLRAQRAEDLAKILKRRPARPQGKPKSPAKKRKVTVSEEKLLIEKFGPELANQVINAIK